MSFGMLFWGVRILCGRNEGGKAIRYAEIFLFLAGSMS